MAKVTSKQKEKPKEILELEKMFGIELNENEFSMQNVNEFWYSVPSFHTNSSNEVIELNLPGLKFSDIGFLREFICLEYINLSKNTIEDISNLNELRMLREILLHGNQVKDISGLSGLKNLKKLVLWRNPIKDFNPISQLNFLEQLYCSSLSLVDISFLENKTSLVKLDLGHNEIVDISILQNLKSLNSLWLQSNRIKDVSALAKLTNLTFLNLEENLIRELPAKVMAAFKWQAEFEDEELFRKHKLFVDNNPLNFPPISVLSLGRETIKGYYNNAVEFGHEPLSEGRIIFIGDGSAGKSSIIEKVLYNSFTLGREQTNGIKIEHLHLQHPEDGRDLSFHIWDFGGQEIQHAVHKFFFTEGCLYVLVLDNRKEEEPEYWLQQIESLGGNASVLVVFNKQDENAAETADRKYLREKYPNIVGFYNTSCKTNFGIEDFKRDLEKEVVKLRTVEEQFPNNWLAIKKAIEERTNGSQHYLTYEVYQEICKQNNADTEETQKLLLKYFNTIGAVTWFGENTFLKFLHVLNPTWITQGVYKILTAKKTANLFGQIKVSDFKELLQPINKDDYTYDEAHYGYILSMMQKFDLCDTQDGENLLIPSAFGKMPKVEYSEFRGETVRTYILQFKDYMPLALIHRFTAKKIKEALDSNYWYTGIVIKDGKSNSVAMVHADKEAKRIYIRIKGEAQLGMWEYIRREFDTIASSYAKIPYDELVAVDENIENYVNYDDLISHVQAHKEIYFHPKLQQDFNVGYLIGKFETKESTIEKIKKGEIGMPLIGERNPKKIPAVYLNIINNNSPTVNTQINAQINIDIDINLVNNISSTVKGDANYLIEALGDSNKLLTDALQKVVQFAEDAKAARNTGDVKEKSWGRKLKSVLEILSKTGEQLKNIEEGKEVINSILHGVKELAVNFNLKDVSDWFMNNPGSV